jgi:septation ring formation regulator EzrA
MPTDDHIVSQFASVSNALSGIHRAIQETNKSVGRVEGVQRTQAESLKRVEERLDNSNKETQRVVDDLKLVTRDVKKKMDSIIPKVNEVKETNRWMRAAFSPENTRMALLIIAAIVAAVLGISFPFLS